MAIYGVGIDLVQRARIEKILERWGNRFMERVFTVIERETCCRRKNPAPCFSMRFAAKEAFVKALGLGMRAPLSWLDVEVRTTEMGKPEIHLSRKVQEFCESRGIRAWHVSLTDDGEYGAAVVILET